MATGRRIAGALACLAAAAALAACSRWQTRADDLQQTLDAFAASGQKNKGDFVARYGPPTSCAPVPAGESCVWRGAFGALGGGPAPRGATPRPSPPVTERVRVIFDKYGAYVSGTGGVRRGKRTYRGVTEAEEEADEAPICQPGEVFQFGRCYATSPGGGPPGATPPNMSTP